MQKFYFDGGSRGNPGLAAGAGVTVIEGQTYKKGVLLTHETNNVAEYHGLLSAIKLAIELKVDKAEFIGDSKLVVCQVKGEWKINKDNLRLLQQECVSLLKKFPQWTISWIPREKNGLADQYANDLMDGK